MFEYESEIIIAIRGSQEPALERIIKDTKEVYNLCNEIKQLLAITGNIMLNVFIAVSIILIVFFHLLYTTTYLSFSIYLFYIRCDTRISCCIFTFDFKC